MNHPAERVLTSVRSDIGVAGAEPVGPVPATATDLQLGGDGLDFGVGMERLMAHLAAPAGLLVSAERQCRVEHVVAVDPDGPGPELLGQSVGLGDVLSPDAGPEAVFGVVG